MKIHIEIECTPDEAREFLGLPDVEQANAIYVESITSAMKGVSSAEQLEQYAKQLAPMGQMGLKMFQSFVESAGAGGAGRERKTGSGPEKNS